MRRLGKFLLYLLLALVIVLILVAVLAYVVLGTNAGFRQLTGQISNRVEGLSLQGVSGSLSDQVVLERATWEQDSLSADATGVNLTLSTSCLLSRQVCVDALSINRLEVVTTPPAEPPPEKTPAKIELPDLKLPVDANLKNISLDEVVFISESADGTRADPVIIRDITLSAASEGSVVTLDNLSLAVNQFALSANGQVTTTGDYPLDVLLTLNATDIVEENDIAAKFKLTNSLEQLFVNATIDDAIDASIAGVVKPLEPDLPVELGIEWDAIGWPLDNPSTALSENARIDISGTLDDYHVTLNTRLSGEQIPDTRIELAGKANTQRALLHDVTVYTLDGFVTGSAAADWSRDIAWVTQLVTRDINPGVKYDDMDGKLNGLFRLEGFVVDGNWSAALTTGQLDGSLRDFPFNLDVQASRSLDEQLQIQRLTLENGPNTVNVNGSYTDTVDATVELNLPALHYLLPDIAGTLNGTAQITGDVTQPDVAIDVASSVLRFQDILIRDVSVLGTIQSALLENSDVSVNVAQLQQGQTRVDDIDFGLTGTRAAHTVTLNLQGPENTSADINLTGGLTDTFDWNGALTDTRLGLPQHQVSLVDQAAIQFSRDNNAVTVNAHCWATGEARLCLDETMTASASGSMDVSLSNYLLTRLNPLLADALVAGNQNAGNSTANKPRIGGTLDTQATVQWGLNNQAFNVEARSRITDGSIAQTDINGVTHAFRYSSLDIGANMTPEQLSSTIDLQSNDLGSGQASVTMNTADADKTIRGNIALTGFDLGFLSTLVPDINESGGTVNIEGVLSGSLAAPLFDGRIELQQPVLNGEALPLALEGGAIITDIAGTNATITGDLTTDGGDISVSGDVAWPTTTGVTADVRIKSAGLTIAQPPVTQASLLPDIRIQFADQAIAVSGSVQVPSADINIKDLPEGTSSLSDDVIVIEDVETQQADNQSVEASVPLGLDVAVDILLGDEVNLSGYGLIATLGGEINVTKTDADPPQLFGELLISEGLYKSYGQNLNVQNGQILFVGPVDQTRLDIQAVRYIENEDRVAGLQIEGPLNDPVVTLFTDPADKTQESILSYIVLGRDLGDNSSEDSNLLANAALALTLKEGRGFATGFAESLGISDFSIEASGSGDDTQVVLTGRLSDRLLLRYGRGVFAADESLFLRYDITKSLYLEAAQGVERAVDLFYSFSF